MVLSSRDFDKVFVAFIIASCTQAMGKEASMSVTFLWLSAFKKPDIKTAGKQYHEKMVLWVSPKGPLKLGTFR